MFRFVMSVLGMLLFVTVAGCTSAAVQAESSLLISPRKVVVDQQGSVWRVQAASMTKRSVRIGIPFTVKEKPLTSGITTDGWIEIVHKDGKTERHHFWGDIQPRTPVANTAPVSASRQVLNPD